MFERTLLKQLLRQSEAPQELQGRILGQIQRSMLRRVWIEILATAGVALALVAYIFSVWSALWIEIQESSVLEFGRLFWSDPDILLSNLRETAWSLVEVLPFELLLIALLFILFATCATGFLLRLREVRQTLRPHMTS